MTVPDTKAEGLEVVAYLNRHHTQKRGMPSDLNLAHNPYIFSEPLVRLSDAQAMEARALAREAGLREALERILPTNIGDNPNVPNSMVLPCDVTMGEIRQARAALSREGDHGEPG